MIIQIISLVRRKVNLFLQDMSSYRLRFESLSLRKLRNLENLEKKNKTNNF